MQLERGLEGEDEIIDRAEKRKLRLAHRAREPGLGAMRNLFGDEGFEIGVITHAVALRARGEIPIEATDRRQVQAPEHPLEIVDRGRRARGRAPTRPRGGSGAAAHDTASVVRAASAND